MPPAAVRLRMGTHTAWQALRQRPWRFLASPWPWRSLAYLLCGIMPSGALAAAVLALLASRSSNAAPLVLPPVALAITRIWSSGISSWSFVVPSRMWCAQTSA